jgi:predicted nucleic acid-binding protein
MRIAVDTNVLGYAEGLDDEDKRTRAADILLALRSHDLVMPLQVAAELHHLIMRRRKTPPKEAGYSFAYWRALLARHPATLTSTLDTALDLAAAHRLQIFDAIILAAAAEAGCRMLLSEDMQDGFVWRGVMVVNPFAPTPHPLLADLLRH